MRTISEGYVKASDPLDMIKKDPNKDYIIVSNKPINGQGYQGYETQVDYFQHAKGYEVESDVDRKYLPNRELVVMSIDKKERQARDERGRQETFSTLDPSTTAEHFGSHAEVSMTRNDFGSDQWNRSKPKQRGRPKKNVSFNG